MQVIENPPEKTWREALNDPAATFFHTPEWSRLMEVAFPGHAKSWPVGFQLDDGALAVLPVVRWSGFCGLTSSVYSMFPGVYGGPVCSRELKNRERLAINEWLAGRKSMRCFSLTPPGVPNPLPKGASALPMSTQRLRLEKDLDLQKAGILSHGKKYSIRRAEREGIRVSTAESIDAWRDYYRAYQASISRWEKSPAIRYPLRLFEAMAEDQSGGIHLWVASVGEDFAAGAVVLSFGRHIVTWHEASFQEFHRLRVKDYLLIKVIEDAAQKGFPYFDFNPSGGHQSVEEFKASFGAEVVALEAWMREPAWVRTASRMTGMLKRR
jgi:hypothetical protein